MKMSAEYHTLDDRERLNELMSTGVLYASIMGAGLAVVTVLLASYPGKFFHIEQAIFRQLLLIAGLSWSLGMVFNIYAACMDGFQRFDIFGRIWIVTTLLHEMLKRNTRRGVATLCVSGGMGMALALENVT